MDLKLYGSIDEKMLEYVESKLESMLETDKEINVYINSEGGSVPIGLKLISLIASKNCKTTSIIEFMAASMAADIAMSCDKVFMSKFGLLMFHSAWSGENKLSESAKQYLERQSEMLFKFVVEKRGIDAELFAKLNKQEYWLTCDEAIKIGLVDAEYESNFEFANFNEVVASKSIDQIMNVYKTINQNMENTNEEVLIELNKETKAEIENVDDEIVDDVNKEIKVEVEVSVCETPEMKTEVEQPEMIDYESKYKELELVNTEMTMKLEDLSKMYNECKKELDMLKGEKEMLIQEEFNKKVETVLSEAVKSGKIQEADKWKDLLHKDFETAVKLIDTLPSVNKKAMTFETVVKTNSVNDRSNWSLKDWEKNDSKGLAEILKTNKPLYAEMFKKQYGTEFKG